MAIGSNRLYRAPSGDADRSWFGLLDRVIIAPRCNIPFADADGDGDVDQEDLGIVQACYTGGTETVSQSCACYDHDSNGASNSHVDGDDLTAFSNCITGPGIDFDPLNPPADCRP